MNCANARLLLDDLVDGALAEPTRAELNAHLDACAGCQAAEARLRALVARAAALPRSVEPGRDLWPGIAERITARNVITGSFAVRVRRWIPLRAAAVAAAVLVAATAVVTAVLVRSERTSRLASAPGSEAGSVVPAAVELSEARGTYEAARRQLLSALEARRGSLSPATCKVVDENLRIIERAMRDMEVALARDPGNRELPALLAAAYRQEIDMLQSVAGIPAHG